MLTELVKKPVSIMTETIGADVLWGAIIGYMVVFQCIKYNLRTIVYDLQILCIVFKSCFINHNQKCQGLTGSLYYSEMLVSYIVSVGGIHRYHLYTVTWSPLHELK